MNQTVTVNISGIVFHIEIDAYEELKQYLNKIKSYFNNSQESEEIMIDIEARIAELFNQNLSESNQVILMKDVKEVIAVMGKPEQYLDEEEVEPQKHQGNHSTSSHKRYDRKLFRNTDQRALGGVCSGIAAYMGIATAWMRLLFIFTTLFYGVGPFIYIILWMVVPAARTASDKLQMQGEPINVDNIGKKVEEEAEKVNERFKNTDTHKLGNAVEQFFTGLIRLLSTIFNGIGKILGGGLLVLGLFLGVCFLISLFTDGAILINNSPNSFRTTSFEFLELFFASKDQFYIFLFGALAVLFIPIVGLILGGLKILFNVKTNSGLGISLIVLWFIGLFTTITFGVVMASNYQTKQRVKEVVNISRQHQNYTLMLNKDEMPGDVILETDNFYMASEDDAFYGDNVTFTIQKSESDSMELVILNESRGKTKKDALKGARNVNYHFSENDDTLVFDGFWSALKAEKYRKQEVELILKLPINTSIYLDESMREIIYDIENVTNTWDHDMLEHQWMMLEEGLTCMDCDWTNGETY